MPRKKVDNKEKITLVRIWVKKKHAKKAQADATKIEKKYKNL